MATTKAIKHKEAVERQDSYNLLSIDAKIARAKKGGGKKGLEKLLKIKNG